MVSLRARVWVSFSIVVVAGFVAWNVRDLPRTSWPAPGPLASRHAGTEVSVTLSDDIATLHIRAGGGVLYGMGLDVDEWTGERWVNRFVGMMATTDVVKPIRPKQDMFWPAPAGFGASDVRVDVSALEAGTYRLRKGFFTGSHPDLVTFDVAATFTIA